MWIFLRIFSIHYVLTLDTNNHVWHMIICQWKFFNADNCLEIIFVSFRSYWSSTVSKQTNKKILSSTELHRVWKFVPFYLITSHTVWWCFLSQRKDYCGNRFYEHLENGFYLHRKCSSYFGCTEMFSLCDIEKLFLWQSIAQASLFP